MHRKDIFVLERVSEYLEILNEMQIGFDFDDEDLNFPYWRKINHFITSKYFEYRKRLEKS